MARAHDGPSSVQARLRRRSRPSTERMRSVRFGLTEQEYANWTPPPRKPGWRRERTRPWRRWPPRAG